jgi:uncharacterized membrane protein (DUF485 family)
MSVLIASKIQSNPRYHELIKKRDGLAWTLTAIVFLMYMGFILMIAFAPGILTAPIGDTVVPQGMLIGVGVILASCITTGIYVYKANGEFDNIVHEIVEEASK